MGLCQSDLCQGPGRPNRATEQPLSVSPHSIHWEIEREGACRQTVCPCMCVEETTKVGVRELQHNRWKVRATVASGGAL